MIRTLLNKLVNLQYPEEWLEFPVGACASLLFGSLVSWMLLSVTDSKWLAIYAAMSVPVVGILVWRAVRDVYWDSGRELKIGIGFDNIEVPHEEIKRIRAHVKDESSDSKKLNISIKLVPYQYLAVPVKAEKFRNKWDFLCCFNIRSELDAEAGSRYEAATTSVSWESVDKHFEDMMHGTMHALKESGYNARLVTKNPTRQETIQYTAKSLYESILAQIALGCFAISDFNNAVKVLGELDLKLSEVLGEDEIPRLPFRQLAAGGYSLLSSYKMKEIYDSPDLVSRSIEILKRANDILGHQFPMIGILLARYYFLNGDIKRAYDTIMSCKEVLDSRLDFVEKLGKGLVSLAVGEFAKSRDYYIKAFRHANRNEIDWEDVIEFTEYATETCDSVIVAKVLYKTACNGSAPAADLALLDKWIGNDSDKQKWKAFIQQFKNVISGSATGQPQFGKKKGRTKAKARRGNRKKRRKNPSR